MTKLKSPGRERERGSALLIALLASSLLAGLGLALAGLGSVEATIAANHRAGYQLFQAADAALGAALVDLAATQNWSDILSGLASSRFSGSTIPPAGPGEPLQTLAQLTVLVQTENAAWGSWGTNTPQWRQFGHGWLRELAPVAGPDSDDYVATWVADDVGETDGDPMTDTNGRVQITARASNARGMHRSILATVAQTPERTALGFPGVRILAWRELR